ncbi:hypothetical protein GCL60_15050 [Silvanigrella paludirubra]|jgi:hypothetical protein|uniref:Uncharacterized protein n=1 Tax=Silvanigrella paludirubra TaxID=2499159 RepID=A0A6N6VQ54_9BACT|nr:hypothetical protein [Silvanigrella paludirubra]KAB8037144.1 hypothetical protein GCL60_15050 [Silvanigrella paludirubra]
MTSLDLNIKNKNSLLRQELSFGICKKKKIKLNRKSEYFSKLQVPLEMALKEVAQSAYASKRWIKLCLSYVEFVSPSESSREPARLMRLLSEYPTGLTREEMLSYFYENYLTSSLNRKESLRICLEKIVQRARITFIKYDLTIHYCKNSKRYFIMPLFSTEDLNKNSKS